STTSKNEKVFDFKKDINYVYSAFLQDYRIDLYDVEELHWHKFKSLLHSLSDNVELTKIIGYRSADTSKMDKEQKKFYNKMKKIYSLENEEEKMTTEEYHNDILNRINQRFLQVEKEVGKLNGE
ncbi:MAG: bacteriophage Gp15 family protein, partial [Eubacteriales bacterium]|nr:bacteriophage Gp15 family protein [Eubacteriales bacterium]